MSGPKLSDYGFEDTRKAELERIQREIIRIKTLAMADIQQAQDGAQWCRDELDRLSYQEQLVEASSLDSDQKISARKEIQAQVDQIEDLEKDYVTIQSNVAGVTLEDVKKEQSLISAQISGCRKKKAAIEAGRENYVKLLSTVADDLCRQVSHEGYSLEDALDNLPPRQIVDGNLQEEKSALVQRAQKILKCPNVSETTRSRLKKVLRRISETDNPKELHEIDSLVIGEIERKWKQVGPLKDEYFQLMCAKKVLSEALGKAAEETPQMVDDVVELRQRINEIKAQIKIMEAQLLKKAEHEEIARCIDAAMEELGYDFIGNRQVDNTSSQIKLFEFNRGTGLQVTHRQDGVVRIKVVGLANENRAPTAQEEEILFKEQVDFCSKYEKIIEAFRRKGMLQVGPETRNPASRQFAQIVNVADYNAGDDVSGFEFEKLNRHRQSRTTRKPKVLSK